MEISRIQQIIVDALRGLSELRNQDGNWIDFEIEKPELETQVCKRLDAITCYITAAQDSAIWDEIEPDVKPWLENDIASIFNDVNESGFFPSPYAQIREKSDQYIDFACDLIHFCYYLTSSPALSSFKNISKEILIKAVTFLVKEEN